MENIKNAYADGKNDLDRGDAVQTVLIIAGFAIVCILLIQWIGTAILNKGADTATCIEGANTYDGKNSGKACKETNHSEDKSFKNDDGYKGRYGS